MSVWLIFGDDLNDALCSSRFRSLAIIEFILNFVYLYMRRTEYIVEYDIKSKYPEEYSTFDKVGRKNLFRFRINRLLISYLISKRETKHVYQRASLYFF